MRHNNFVYFPLTNVWVREDFHVDDRLVEDDPRGGGHIWLKFELHRNGHGAGLLKPTVEEEEGAGPGGHSSASALQTGKPSPVCWYDPSLLAGHGSQHQGGREDSDSVLGGFEGSMLGRQH